MLLDTDIPLYAKLLTMKIFFQDKSTISQVLVHANVVCQLAKSSIVVGLAVKSLSCFRSITPVFHEFGCRFVHVFDEGLGEEEKVWIAEYGQRLLPRDGRSLEHVLLGVWTRVGVEKSPPGPVKVAQSIHHQSDSVVT